MFSVAYRPHAVNPPCSRYATYWLTNFRQVWYNGPMTAVHDERLRLLMRQSHLSTAELLTRLRRTGGNERVSRVTLSKVINGSYRARPSVVFVRGLAQALNTTSDYLLGLSSEPNAMAIARQYALANEEQLLSWLAEQSPELAEIMRTIREIPEEEQQYILEALTNDIKAIQSRQESGAKGNADA